MRTSQYLEIYQKTIPLTEKMISMIGKRRKVNRNNNLEADGIVTDVRFSKDGDLRIKSEEYGTDCLAFEIQINGKWYGHFPSGINTPEQTQKFDNFFNKDAENYL